jgi:hypothetical protein
MAKTHTKKKSEQILTPKMCDNITGHTGDQVYWQNIPAAGCSVTKGNTEWPFGDPYPLNPAATHPFITVRPPITTPYEIVVSCCPSQATKTVMVTP